MGRMLGEPRGRRCWADLGEAAATEKLVLKNAEAALGQVDILINNAGLTRDGLADAHEGRGLEQGAWTST